MEDLRPEERTVGARAASHLRQVSWCRETWMRDEALHLCEEDLRVPSRQDGQNRSIIKRHRESRLFFVDEPFQEFPLEF